MLVDGLRELGAKPACLEVYRIKRKFIPAGLESILSKKMDAIVFTSSENVHSFFSVIKNTGMIGAIRKSRLVCLGEPTSVALKGYGFEGTTPRKFTFSHLVKKVLEKLKDG